MQKTKKLTQDHVSGLEDTLLTYRKSKPFFTPFVTFIVAVIVVSFGLLFILLGIKLKQVTETQSFGLQTQVVGYILTLGATLSIFRLVVGRKVREQKALDKSIPAKDKLKRMLTLDFQIAGFDITQPEDVLDYIQKIDVGTHKKRLASLTSELVDALKDIGIPVSLEVGNESFEKRTVTYADTKVQYEKVIF